MPHFFFPRKTVTRVKITDFVASEAERGLADRWFWRLVVFNLVLALAAFGAWTYLPIQIPVKNGPGRATSRMEIMDPCHPTVGTAGGPAF